MRIFLWGFLAVAALQTNDMIANDNVSDFQDPNSGTGWVSLQNFGEVQYGSQTLPSLSFHGNVQLNNTTITVDTVVSGQFQASGATLNNLTVNGIMELNAGTLVTGNVIINGLTAINNSTIAGNMTVASDNIILRGATIQNLTVKTSGALSQVVTVSNNSRVLGKIRFEKAGGIVQLDTTSQLPDNAVENGTIQRN